MFRPMLSATVKDLKYDVIYPTLGSPKLDGIRALVFDGVFYSRRMKVIPNPHVHKLLGNLKRSKLDGELVVIPATTHDCFRRTSSLMMSKSAVDAFNTIFYTFDIYDTGGAPQTYEQRYERLRGLKNEFVRPLLHVPLNNAEEARIYEEKMIELGYEGIILRAPWQVYKQGRSTLSEQGMMKVKRFMDDEATVVGFEEKMHNANEATTSELGYTKRSSHKANQHPTGVLGALVVEWRGMQFNIGTGFDDADRAAIWKSQEAFKGKTVKFKYLPVLKDAPRHPVFLGWRED